MKARTAEDALPSGGRSRLETDELAGVTAAVCANFPSVPPADVEALVANVFQHRKAHAAMTAHLIPLTLNRSVRLMREATKSSQDIAAVSRSALRRQTG